MFKAIQDAIELLFSNNPYLDNIIATTLKMAFTSSVIALLVGAPIGIILAISSFKGRSIIITIQRTLMGLPPVAVGIVVYILFSGTGPFGHFGLIYSVKLMIIAQTILITPIVAGMMESYITKDSSRFLETTKGIGLRKGRVFLLAANEGRNQLIATYLFAFSRAISEVGAVQIVGGNILYQTRVMTTTIALNYNTGQFDYAVALGIILLLIALVVNTTASIIERRLK